MNRGLWILVFLGVIGLVIAAKSPSGVFSSQDKDNTLSLLQRGRQKDGSFVGLKNTYFATQTYNLLKTPVPAKDQVCDFVSKALKSMNVEDIFYTAAIESALSCASSVATNSKAVTAVNDVLQSANAELKDLTFAVRAAVLISAKNSNAFPELAKAEKKLLSFAEEDGQFLPKAKADLGNIYDTGVALETLAELAAKAAPSDAVKTALKNARQIFDLIVEDDKNGVAFFEDVDSKDTNVKVSSQFFSGLTTLSAQLKTSVDVDKEQIIALAQYFVNNKNPSSLESAYFVVKALSAIAKNNVYVPMVLNVESSSLSAKSAKDLSVTLTDIFGNPSEKAKVTLVSLKAQGSSSSALSNVALESKGKSRYELQDILTKAKVSSGVLNAEFSVNPEDEKFLSLEKVTRRLKVLGSISVADAKITIAAASAKDTEGTVHKVGDFPAKLKETLKFNGNRKMTVDFKVKEGSSENTRVHQAFVKLSCDKCEEDITVPAKYSDKGYSATLNLHSIALKLFHQSGVYELELVVADFSATSGVSWKVGKIDVSFEDKPASRETPFDPLPEIKHQFRPAEKRAGKGMASIFTMAVLGAPWAVLFLGWVAYGVNISNFPFSGPAFIDAVIFQGCIGAALFLYFSYWVGMTMFTTLTYLGLLLIPGVFFGQRALNQFAEKQKKD